jgi:Carboxypeptidase regulatory-like domain/TonB dependent receptor
MFVRLKQALLLGFLPVLFSLGIPASAQIATADIVGAVTDDSGAVLPNARVTVTNTATNESRASQSNGAGDYAFNLLQPGPYSVTIEAPGFKTFTVKGLTLVAGDRSRADARMQLGQETQTVNVGATPTALQTDSSTLSSVISDRAVQDLPLNGRNYINLVTDSPGVTQGNPNAIASGTRPDDRRQTNSVSANGQPESHNANLIDGMDNSELEQGLIIVRPSVEAIQQVKVDTNSYTAEVGGTAGAVINVITKAGGNAFHGTAYEFFGNDVLQANDYFAKQALLPRPEYRLNQFGGSVGGPIKRDKTFFFADVEAYRLVQGSPTGKLTVPTLFEEQNPGNFSDIVTNGVPGPVIPASQLSPIALEYFALYPAPNVPGAGATSNYSANPRRTQNSTTTDVRIDHHFNATNSIFGRYSYNPVTTFTPGAFPVVNGIQPGGSANFPGKADETAQGLQLNYIHIFTPNLLLELKAGFSRLNIQSLQVNYGTHASTKFGIPNVDNFDSYNTGLLPVSISGYAPLGDVASIPIFDRSNNFQYMGAVTYTRGRHNLKMGAGWIRRQLNYYQAVAGEGQFTWSGSSTTAMANFLKGTPTTITRTNQLYDNYMRTTDPHAFFQDDWRVTHTLTLNLGLRWDYYSPTVNAKNQRSNFDINSLTMRVATASDRSAGIQPSRKNFAPRIGFAQSLGHDLVLRGGFGISFYDPNTGSAGRNLANPPFVYGTFTCQPGSTNVALTCPAGIGTLAQGPPLPSVAAANAGAINLSGGLSAIPFHNPPSYVEQFNLTLQKQYGQNVITASYIGELARKQLSQVNINTPFLSTAATPPPFFYATQLPNVSAITVRSPGGDGSYQAAQFMFERRYARGLQVTTAYTYASNLNDFADVSGQISVTHQVRNNYAYDFGYSDIAIRHHFLALANYELPFGNSASGLKRIALAGWQVNGIATYETGLPFTVMDNAFNPALINSPGVTSDRPNKVPGQSYELPKRTPQQFFNIAAFAPQAHGTAGNEARNQLWGPNDRQIDLSLFKTIPIRESLRLQLQASSFNLTNTENFGQPNSTITAFNSSTRPTNASGFGALTSTRLGATPRQFQFSAKVLF